ncbi:phage head closure protein [Candidatus Pacearchaeota archaeon]|nr:phage head closure protein [Candidatus Pacearchaeota archaeon]
MKAGTLRQRVTIQQPVKTANSIGEDEITWSTFATVWMKIIPASGQIYYAAKQADSRVNGYFSMRYLSGVLPTFRILFGSRILTILAVWIPEERKNELLGTYSESLD